MRLLYYSIIPSELQNTTEPHAKEATTHSQFSPRAPTKCRQLLNALRFRKLNILCSNEIDMHMYYTPSMLCAFGALMQPEESSSTTTGSVVCATGATTPQSYIGAKSDVALWNAEMLRQLTGREGLALVAFWFCVQHRHPYATKICYTIKRVTVHCPMHSIVYSISMDAFTIWYSPG